MRLSYNPSDLVLDLAQRNVARDCVTVEVVQKSKSKSELEEKMEVDKRRKENFVVKYRLYLARKRNKLCSPIG